MTANNDQFASFTTFILTFFDFGALSVFSSDVNLALVKIFFKFGGCRLLGISLILLSFCFILVLACKIEIECVMMG